MLDIAVSYDSKIARTVVTNLETSEKLFVPDDQESSFSKLVDDIASLNYSEDHVILKGTERDPLGVLFVRLDGNMFPTWEDLVKFAKQCPNNCGPNDGCSDCPNDKPGVPGSDLTDEVYREYDIPGRHEPYRIYNPVTLFVRPGGSTHRVLDSAGVVHCIAFPGNGTVLRWAPRDEDNPCSF